MAINISDSFHAAALIGHTVPGTPDFAGQQGFREPIVDNGPGDFTLELDRGVDTLAAVITATCQTSGLPAVVTTAHIDDTHIRVRTWDMAGVALDDAAVAITVHRYAL